MPRLDSFWHAAAAYSGRLDLSSALFTHGPQLDRLGLDELRAAGLSERHVRALHSGRPRQVEDVVIPMTDARYPSQLAPLPYAPPVLFSLGNIALVNAPLLIAIVGARRCTEHGRILAARIARDLTGLGAVVVSGLAHGIDTAAHMAAPERTIAVLGQGIGNALTTARRKAIHRIVDAGGLIVSEFLPEQSAARHTFPQRNRIIAGLTRGTVVVEATRRSGSLITARHALEYGRPVMAVPGHPLQENAAGCLDLLWDGAELVRNANDVLCHLGINASVTQGSLVTRDPVHTAVLSAIGSLAEVDSIIDAVDLPLPVVLHVLSELELTGVIQRLPGDRFSTQDIP